MASTEGVEGGAWNASNRERNITMKIFSLLSALALGMFVSSAAFALDAATPDATAKAAKSAECSKAADAKGLHGKERKKFREECKKGK
jgi:hypothetical protein